MGPDLFGIAWATGFLLVVIGAFALADRLLCGAWDALRGSPGAGLVTGIAAWGDGMRERARVGSPTSPGGAPPESPAPVATERLGAPGVHPWHDGRASVAWVPL